MVPCIIERFTTITFFNFFRPKSFKTVNILLCFKLKNKRKRKKLMALDGKSLKRLRCKTLNSTRVPLIIKKKFRDTIDKVPKLKGTIDNFSLKFVSNVKNYFPRTKWYILSILIFITNFSR